MVMFVLAGRYIIVQAEAGGGGGARPEAPRNRIRERPKRNGIERSSVLIPAHDDRFGYGSIYLPCVKLSLCYSLKLTYESCINDCRAAWTTRPA